jgi:transcriptional regulator with XRE-family HTH domain
MTDIERLKRIMSDSGMTVTAIADKSGIERTTLYNRLKGTGEFTASEIVGLARALHLTKKERDQIFLTNRKEANND